ncbi:hypothetical protein VTN96DRAFT_8986 [Rasamsonia emersonii]
MKTVLSQPWSTCTENVTASLPTDWLNQQAGRVSIRIPPLQIMPSIINIAELRYDRSTTSRLQLSCTDRPTPARV